MGCIDDLDYEILLPSSSFKECADFIIKNFKEVYYVKPGHKILDIYIIGIPPIPIGVDGDYIIIPYVKPCHGCFVVKLLQYH